MEDKDQEIELAGELALAWCGKQVEEVEAIFPLRPEDGADAFRCGWSSACEELAVRFKEKRFNAILEETMAGLETKP